jgi:hypothetical protein
MRPRHSLALCAAITGLTFAAATPPLVEAAPDQTQGVALMSATVAANGDLVRGSGVVTSVRDFAGNYTVTFERPITACTAVGSVNDTIGVEFPSPVPGSVSVAFLGQPTQATVLVTDPDGQPDDLRFQLLVFCEK